MSVYKDERRDVTVTWTRIALGLVAAGIVLAGVIFAGWEAGWWFKAQGVDKQSHINRNSYGAQQSMRDQFTNLLTTAATINYELAQEPSNADALAAQQRAIQNQACSIAQQITGDPLPADQQDWVSLHCELGHYK